MEDNKKEELEQAETTEVKLPEEEQKEESETEDSRDQGLPGTSVGLMLLAGFTLCIQAISSVPMFWQAKKAQAGDLWWLESPFW